MVDCEDVRADAIVLAALAAADKAARVALLGRRRRSEADSTVHVRCITRGVLRLYRACITSVSASYHACIVRGGVLCVYRCVSVCISVLPSP